LYNGLQSNYAFVALESWLSARARARARSSAEIATVQSVALGAFHPARTVDISIEKLRSRGRGDK
jgi:hypothetical protein